MQSKIAAVKKMKHETYARKIAGIAIFQLLQTWKHNI